MTNQAQNSNNKFDLEERTAKYGEAVIKFCKMIRQDHIDKVLINQLVRSATSIGANYMEANGCETKKDFNNKIALCKKEAKETTHWLRMIATAIPEVKDETRSLWKEAHELALIFSAINRSSKEK